VILVNGAGSDIQAGDTVLAALTRLGLDAQARGVAVAVRAIVARAPTRAQTSARVK